jgi:hypothetical protein
MAGGKDEDPWKGWRSVEAPKEVDTTGWTTVEGGSTQGKVLSNVGTDDPDYWWKNPATAIASWPSQAAGMIGDIRDIAELGTSGIESLVRHVIPGAKNKSAEQIRKDAAETRERLDKSGLVKKGWRAPTSHEVWEGERGWSPITKETFGEYKPQTTEGQLAQAGFKALMPMPGGKVKTGERLIELTPSLWNSAREIMRGTGNVVREGARVAGPTVRRSTMQGLGGVTGEAAAQLSGGDPYWALLGSIAGPAAAESAVSSKRSILGAQTKEGQAREAAGQYGRDIEGAETPTNRPGAVRRAYDTAMQSLASLPDYLKGKTDAQPTIGELSQSRGLALGERAVETADPMGAGALMSERQQARSKAQQEAGKTTVDEGTTGLEVRDKLAGDIEALDQRITDAVPATNKIDEIGQDIRNPLAEQRKVAEDTRTKLYDNMERMFGKQWLLIPGLKAKAEAMMQEVAGYQRKKMPDENIELARAMPDEVQFSKLRVYMKDLNEFIADNRDNTSKRSEVTRAQELKKAIWDDLNGAVTNRLEQQFGKAGERGANADQAFKAAMEQAKREWMDGVQEPPQPKQPMDLAAVAALKEANEAQAFLAKTFRQGDVGDILKGKGDDWNIRNANVPRKAFPGGNDGYRVTKSVLDAAPETLPAVKQAAIASLRDIMKEGTYLKPEELAKWRNKNKESLRAIDSVEPGWSSRFDNLANSHSAIASSFLNVEGPIQAAAAMGKLLRDPSRGPTKLKELLQEAGASSDPMVVEGLKKLALDHMYAEASGGPPRSFGPKLAQQINDYRETLTQIFGPDHFKVLEAISRDAASQVEHGQRMSPSFGNSATQFYQTLEARQKRAPTPSWKESVGGMGVGGLGGALLGYGGGLMYGLEHPAAAMAAGASSLALGTLGYWGSKLKARGINGVKDAYAAGMLDPQLGMRMLRFASENPGSAGWWGRVAPLILASPYYARPGLDEAENQKKKKRAAGGRAAHKFDCASRASKLCREAEMIRKRHAGETKVLLNSSDDEVADALRVASRGL